MINIYVGNLPYSVTDDELRTAFASYGTVAAAEVIFDRRTKRSRGYGFVEMENEADGRKAIAALNGSDFQGRELRVDESQPKEKKPRSANREQGQRQAAPQTAPAAPAAENGGGIGGFIRKLFS